MRGIAYGICRYENEMVSWFSELKDHQTPEWDSLPDLDLYMDQVITYLNDR